MRDPGELSPGQARKLETAAAQFKEFWEGGRVTPEARTAAPAAEDTPKVPDPALIALLRAVERGDDNAIPALASWLEERGDPRASALREVTRWEAGVTGTRTGANEGLAKTPRDTDDSPAQLVRELRRRQQSEEVWRRLGLTWDHSNTLKQYLGINPMGVAATVEEIAKWERKRVQTIRNRIDLALHRLAVPRPRGRRRG
jgi:hypothetical protein